MKHYVNYPNEEYKNEYGGGTWGSIQYAHDRQLRFGTTEDNAVFGVSAGTVDTSHCLIRNFDFFGKLTIDNRPYRLMSFEFQEIAKAQRSDYDYEPTFNDYLQFQVFIKDNTKDVYDALVSQYMSMRGQFTEYYDAAYEFCSYNNVGGNFNTFFQTAMEQQNSEDPEQAPGLLRRLYIIFTLTY